MGLIAEQLRKLAHEEVKTHLTVTSTKEAIGDYSIVRTSGFTLSEPRLVYFKITVEAESSVYGAGRVRIVYDSVERIVVFTGAVENGGSVTKEAFVPLPAGTVSWYVELAIWKRTSGALKNTLVHVATFNFSDCATYFQQGSPVGVNDNADTIILTTTVTPPSARKMIAGTLKDVHILVFGTFVSDERYNRVASGGPLAGYVTYYVEKPADVSHVPAYGMTDRGSYNDNDTYGIGVMGWWYDIFDSAGGADFQIKVKASNRTGALRTCKATLMIIVTPWILPSDTYDDFEPVELDFPPGSTLYLKAEPLLADTTKTMKLGKERIESLGFDFYHTVSGTGVQDFDYTFVMQDPVGLQLFCYGWQGCIAAIGVDVR